VQPAAGAAAPATNVTQIAISNLMFTPATVTAPVGTSVTWVNRTTYHIL
jgi:plastocyanin